MLVFFCAVFSLQETEGKVWCGTRVATWEAVMPTALCWLTALLLLEYKKKFQGMSAGRGTTLPVAALSSREAAPALRAVVCGDSPSHCLSQQVVITYLQSLLQMEVLLLFFVCFNYTSARSSIYTGQTGSIG